MVIYVQVLFFIAISSALSFKHVFCKLNIKTIYSISYYSFYFSLSDNESPCSIGSRIYGLFFNSSNNVLNSSNRRGLITVKDI